MLSIQSSATKEVLSTVPAASPGPAIHSRLTIGHGSDPAESEADAIADKVTQMWTAPVVQRKCADCEEEKQVNRQPINPSAIP
ncbi:MAG: hypothetical protein WD426_12725, partial [Anditalea sp.]